MYMVGHVVHFARAKCTLFQNPYGKVQSRGLQSAKCKVFCKVHFARTFHSA